MKVTAEVKLECTPEQVDALRRTLETGNACCNFISEAAWNAKTFHRFAIYRIIYHDAKSRFGVAADFLRECISKVAATYRRQKDKKHQFRPLGGLAYEHNTLRWFRDAQRISIWTICGRMVLDYACGTHHRELLKYQKGESDLIYRDGSFYLLATCEVPEAEPIITTDTLGVDLGIINLAVDSDGERHSGATVNGIRRRHRRLRQRLQSKGTKSAKRLLKKRRRKESRFARDVNHCIAKSIVAKAQGTQRQLALEDLKGIRARTTARKSQRATKHSWAFAQLRAFITYKAQRVGVPVVLVDPRNTSRTCPACGHVDKANRKSQSEFLCTSCRCSGNADHFAAENIRRAAANQPHVASPTG